MRLRWSFKEYLQFWCDVVIRFVEKERPDEDNTTDGDESPRVCGLGEIGGDTTEEVKSEIIEQIWDHLYYSIKLQKQNLDGSSASRGECDDNCLRIWKTLDRNF